MHQRRTPEAAERLLTQFARTNPDVLWMFSPDWTELHFGDDAYEDLWGRSLDALVEDPLDFLHGIHPNDRDDAVDAVESLSDGTPVELECRIVPADGGDQRDVWIEGRPVRDDDGEFVAIAGYVRDVTERKRYERRLEYSNERLNAFNDFLSHDLKNQLQQALGYLELARAERSDPNLAKVEDALTRMKEMTADVLALPRLDLDSLTCEPVSLDALARRSWDAVASENATLVVEDDETLYVDDGLFRNVFENLFRNAVSHNDATVTVRVGALSDGDGVYVADDGRGIPADDRQTVFETGYSTGGSGLGLALVEEIVAAHGGRISVADAADGGARFEIRGVSAGRTEAPSPRLSEQ